MCVCVKIYSQYMITDYYYYIIVYLHSIFHLDYKCAIVDSYVKLSMG